MGGVAIHIRKYILLNGERILGDLSPSLQNVPRMLDASLHESYTPALSEVLEHMARVRSDVSPLDFLKMTRTGERSNTEGHGCPERDPMVNNFDHGSSVLGELRSNSIVSNSIDQNAILSVAGA